MLTKHLHQVWMALASTPLAVVLDDLSHKPHVSLVAKTNMRTGLGTDLSRRFEWMMIKTDIIDQHPRIVFGPGTNLHL